MKSMKINREIHVMRERIKNLREKLEKGKGVGAKEGCRRTWREGGAGRQMYNLGED